MISDVVTSTVDAALYNTIITSERDHLIMRPHNMWYVAEADISSWGIAH